MESNLPTAKLYFAYLRVSKDDYKDSIDNQKQIIINEAKKRSIPIKNIEFIEEERSGSKDKKREKFEEMLAILQADMKKHTDPAKREYAGVFCFKIDRLARNDKHFNDLFDLLDGGYSFISATETIENTPTGRLLFRMLCSFAIYESEKLGNRISIAQIHNIIQGRWTNLGGDAMIFGYAGKKDENITVVDAERDIIRSIYNIYVDGYCIKNGKRITVGTHYKDIFNALEKKEQDYIEKYIADNGRKTSIDNFVRNIIENDNMLRYNGEIRKTLNINDELIQNYLDVLEEKTQDDNAYDMEGENVVGGTIHLYFFLTDHAIIPDNLYREAQKKFSKKSKSFRDKDELRYNGLFEDFIFLLWNKQEYNATVEYKEQKDWYGYRRKISLPDDTKKNMTISEKIIESAIRESGVVEKIQSIPDETVAMLIDLISSQYRQDNFLAIKRITGSLNLYNHRRDWAERNMKAAKTLDEKELYQKKYRSYTQEISDLTDQLALEKKGPSDLGMGLGELFRMKNFYKSSIFEKRLFYKTFFEKITYDRYDHNGEKTELTTICIFLSEFLVELGLPRKVTQTIKGS